MTFAYLTPGRDVNARHSCESRNPVNSRLPAAGRQNVIYPNLLRSYSGTTYYVVVIQKISMDEAEKTFKGLGLLNKMDI
jgi:hypothetical protein